MTESQTPSTSSNSEARATVILDTAKLFHQESKAARDRVESLFDKYRTNTSTLLALATAAVAFFGFATGPRHWFWYGVTLFAYGAAVALALSIYNPVRLRVNVAHDTEAALFADPSAPLQPTEIYYGYGCGHQEAVRDGLRALSSPLGVANRFRILVLVVAVLVVAASLSVSLGTKSPPAPTHIVIEG